MWLASGSARIQSRQPAPDPQAGWLRLPECLHQGSSHKSCSFRPHRHVESRGEAPGDGDVPSPGPQNRAPRRKLPLEPFQLLFYSPFFLPKTTLSLPVGCWRKAVLPGLGSGSHRKINKALVSTERSAQPGSLHSASPIPSPQAATGVQGKGRGAQGAPPGFSPSTVGQPATQSGLCCSQLAWEFGGSLLGSPGEPQDLGTVSSVLALVAGTSHSALPWQAALKWKARAVCFSISAGCSFRLLPGRSGLEQGRKGPRPGEAHGSPEHCLLCGLASRGPSVPHTPSAPQFPARAGFSQELPVLTVLMVLTLT